MATLQNPSSVVITDRQTMAENFVENGTGVFCDAAFIAGGYAIAGTLLGAPPLSATAALLTTGALLGAMALCPSRPTQDGVFGQTSVIGGQCVTDYRVRWSVSDPSFMGASSGVLPEVYPGSIVVFTPTTFNTGAGSSQRWGFDGVGGGGNYPFFQQNPVVTPQGASASFSLVRADGLPDNCGDYSSGGQVINNINEGDTIDSNNVTDNSTTNYIIPVAINLGGVTGILNLNFGGIKIGSLFPLNFDMEIGGIRFSFGEDTDGTIRLKPTNPDLSQPGNKDELLRQLLEKTREIKECICTPDVDLDMLFMPYVDSAISCDVETATLLVPEGSVSASLFQSFQSTAFSASERCKESAVENVEPELIFSATTLSDGTELFTGEIGVDVRSLYLSITEINSINLEILSIYPSAQQRKFGSVSFVLSDIDGGGDYLYIFDQETYIPLPRRSKTGKLRVLMKPGISFEVFDTGERYKF